MRVGNRAADVLVAESLLDMGQADAIANQRAGQRVLQDVWMTSLAHNSVAGAVGTQLPYVERDATRRQNIKNGEFYTINYVS